MVRKMKAEMPWLLELNYIVEQLDDTARDVLILALLDYCETGKTESAYKILPPYLIGYYEQYKAVLDKYSEEL